MYVRAMTNHTYVNKLGILMIKYMYTDVRISPSNKSRPLKLELFERLDLLGMLFIIKSKVWIGPVRMLLTTNKQLRVPFS